MRDYVRDLYAEEFKEAEKKSREEGKSEGITIGLEQGKVKRETEIAKQMISKNYSIKEIQSLTGLSKKDITKLMK